MIDIQLEMMNISKSFPGVKALDNVSLKVRKGTVHALMGENGAGKSTLMKCLFGIYSMDAGEIKFNGEPVSFKDSNDALEHGIAMIHQELQPITEMTIAENIYLGNYPLKNVGPLKMVDHAKMNKDAEEVLKSIELPLPPTTKLKELSVSQMQSVEIAKAISHQAKVIIMDEPTSSLTQSEVEVLFTIINKLRNDGVSIIYISHKMDEILRISDDISIMRDGKYVGTWPANEMTIDAIIAQMVGRELTDLFPSRDVVPSEEVKLEVQNITSVNPRSFKNISFNLRKGEILGIGGLVGAQRTEMVEALFGIRTVADGLIVKDGKILKISRPQDAIKNKIALLTEDRRATGILGVLSITDNVAIASIDQYVEGFKINQKKVDKIVNESIEKLSIKTPSNSTKIMSLSGGNQQKVLISRWLANDPDVLILDEPTRGIDVGAKYEIYTIMNDLVAQGKSIIMISSEMSELLGMSDRIMIMCEGRQSGILDKEEATQEKIMTLATKFM
ncbi:sugar ABC transporter ATP-binding protein [Erysipelothrix larvae]|uniref:Ribose/galactose/methyl galactoside import ATP-binding protein n=1 Tax=Erysipelothrix larvae TaxID=1514105 RepID=A0A109UH59_9FIRM|nr:sugar ABC transporter ATP-binding protein [Erysipelothrix larvae]AMC93778.1 sugar ABC transporter ATP-binding protein [Erysipelothrix larvae]